MSPFQAEMTVSLDDEARATIEQNTAACERLEARIAARPKRLIAFIPSATIDPVERVILELRLEVALATGKPFVPEVPGSLIVVEPECDAAVPQAVKELADSIAKDDWLMHNMGCMSDERRSEILFL